MRRYTVNQIRDRLGKFIQEVLGNWQRAYNAGEYEEAARLRVRWQKYINLLLEVRAGE